MEIDCLETLLAHIVSNIENRRLYYIVCPISDIEIEFAAQVAGLDLTGFRHPKSKKAACVSKATFYI